MKIKYSKQGRNKIIFSLLLIILLSNISSSYVSAETIPAHTTDLNIYRFTEIIDVCKDGSVNIWIIVILRFNQEENRSSDYFVKFSLYPTKKESITVYPVDKLYSNFFSYSIVSEDKVTIEFDFDKNINKNFEYFSFAFKYQVDEGHIVKKISKWDEPYDRWKLNHYIGIPQTISNYIRLCIILPEETILQNIEGYIEDDSIPEAIELTSYLKFDQNKTIHNEKYIEDLNNTIYQNGIFLYKIKLEEISSVFEFSTYQTLSSTWAILLGIVILGMIIVIILAILSAIKKTDKFLRMLIGMIWFSGFSFVVSYCYFRDVKIAITLLIACTSIVIAVFSIYFSKKNSDKTNRAISISEENMKNVLAEIKRLINDFEKKQMQSNKNLSRKIDGLPELVNRITNRSREEIPALEENEANREKLKGKIKTKKFRDETSSLLKMIVSEIKKYFPDTGSGFIEYLGGGKQIDFLIQLPEKIIPIEVKKYPKKIIANHLPNELAKTMNFLMGQVGTDESALIIMNPGISQDATKILIRQCYPNKLHIIKGTKVRTVRQNLIRFLKYLKNQTTNEQTE